ncbi:HPP family protein [Methylomonas sp. AM2-LC]|uniref:HPP family protein n=1 Tax=Methylomonas sp. AM2-LC TaxID=3153301 RepID=UPI00326411DC
MTLRNKTKNSVTAQPPRPSITKIISVWLASCLAISAIAILSEISGHPWILGSFGASCVLLFGFPEAAFSQPRNLFVGHLLCSTIGLLFLNFVGPHWWCMALAVSTALVMMLITRSVHPPAGSNAVIIFLTHPDWQFIVFPTFAGAIVLWFLGYLYQKIMVKIQ